MPETRRVVIVEDDFLVTEYLRQVCEDVGAPVVGNAMDADTALDLIDELRPEFVLMDVRLPGARDGVDLAHAVYERHPWIRVIFVTGSNEPLTIRRINADHPYRILIKPINPEDLGEALAGD